MDCTEEITKTHLVRLACIKTLNMSGCTQITYAAFSRLKDSLRTTLYVDTRSSPQW